MELFAYGSLIFNRVMYAVTGRRYDGRPARLPDHARYLVQGATYPGLIPSVGSTVEGVLYSGLGNRAFRLLDRFEGEHYRRSSVAVDVGNGVVIEADTFIFKDDYQHLLTDELWDSGTFESAHLTAFLDEYSGFTWIDS
ncbi:TPA: gamma-glutamylcyclotransferase [Candidatus Latescibacteria bacterium]|nr:gamma-glutamylcyclotransferase [Candidatus Latescibacterota bacterium]